MRWSSPHGAVANALRGARIENGNARRIGAEQARSPCLIFYESSDGGEQIDRCRDTAAERLRSDVDPAASEAHALPLDGLMLDVLVTARFDNQRVGELAALDDLRRGRGGHDRVVVGARDASRRGALQRQRERGSR